MDRREWLKRVLGAATAAAVAPLIDLTDTTPAFWNQEPLQKLMPWRVTFPDSTTFTFKALVTGEKLLEDGTVQLTVRPQGGYIITTTDIGRSLGIELDEDDDYMLGVQAAEPTAGAVVSRQVDSQSQFVDIAELNDITLPNSLDFGGLQRRSTFTFNLRWNRK